MLKLGYGRPTFGTILAFVLTFAAFCPAAAAIEVVVNKSVSVSYNKADIRAIFCMQKRQWPNNRQIKVYTLPDSNPLHKDFAVNILNMLPYHIRKIWDRMTFSGTGIAPIELESEQDMIDKIANTPDSIGYLDSRPDNDNIRSFQPK